MSPCGRRCPAKGRNALSPVVFSIVNLFRETICVWALRHEFLIVRGAGEYTGMEFLVEPALKQHFTIPHPAPDYDFALSRVPDVFVGGSCRIAPLVQLLCALMADSFEGQGLALPPWRREAAMLSKWLPQPNRMRDTPVPTPTGLTCTLPSPSECDATPRAAASAGFAGSTIAAVMAAAAAALGRAAQPLPPPPSDGVAMEFSRTESSTSNVSGSDCGDMTSLGCSPLPELLRPSSPSDALVERAGAGGGSASSFWAVHGFSPSSALPGGASPPGACGSASASTAVGIGGISGKSPAPGGLLAARLQQQHRDTHAVVSSGAMCGDTAVPAASGEREQPLIRMRAPVLPGEMAIRVVKMIGFALPPPKDGPMSAASASAAAEPARVGGLGPWRRGPPGEGGRAVGRAA
ncbi:hypothetical protein GPECTOR_16g553 [Gonium pectorale]|uniref:Uncharacterized protein n=1 Tax=Gonium pectorale TaxID=33097 RepID=A0A150GM31_GONPE|nr:hypothetical protein GPECTOR_16g553 [Gonium pectorale]|eukprot:KXZ50380.1 hypothetical protein GPECTOR_16g553 [Gonium pectorale]